MKLFILTENTTCRNDLTAEHGLSLYIETGDQRILFDTGASGAFAENADKLGIDLSLVTLAVISHGHYDHGGGLARFLEVNTHAPVYIRQEAFSHHYNADGKDIGISPDLAGHPQIVLTGNDLSPAPGLRLFSCNDRPPLFPIDSSGMTAQCGERMKQEDFRHEQYLLIEEEGKRVLISGCSHKGICNIQGWLRPDVLVGGFHYMKLDPEGCGQNTLEAAAQYLSSFPTTYYTGHCTGEKAFSFLKAKMGSQLHAITTGSSILL